MPRARDLGVVIGALPTGPTNSVLDVAGVGPRSRHRPSRRAASSPAPASPLLLAEDAYLRPVPAGGAVLNGAGECTGFLTAAEWGAVETPVYLTSTMQLGRVYDAACELALERAPRGGRRRGDPGRRRVRRLVPQRLSPDAGHRGRRPRRPRAPPSAPAPRRRRPTRVRSAPGPGCPASASRAASAPPPGSTAEGHTVAVLLLTNFGAREELTVAGVPVGRLLAAGAVGPAEARPARASGSSSPTRPSTARPAPGWRAGSGSDWRGPGSVAHHGSGEIFLGVRHRAAARPRPAARTGVPLTGRGLDPLFAAVVEAAEEAVLNSMFTAPTTVGRDGNTSESLHDPEVLALLGPGRDRPRRSGSRSRDGVALAATLYLPDPAAGPQPCLLEALPYRKDDLTSSYAAGYEDLRDRVRVRGLPGRPARHRVVVGRRHRRVPARGAGATWSR